MATTRDEMPCATLRAALDLATDLSARKAVTCYVVNAYDPRRVYVTTTERRLVHMLCIVPGAGCPVAHPGESIAAVLRDGEPPEQKLRRLLEERGPQYRELADLRIQTDDLSQQESAYGVAESARVFFAGRSPAVAAAAESV
jgi:hypothetical protein